MVKDLIQSWWIFAIRGIAAIIFGVIAVAWPDRTLPVLVLVFGAYALVDGLALLGALVTGDPLARSEKWSVAIMGLLGVGAGAVTFFWPGVTALALLYIVATWAIATGFLQVAAAIEFRKAIDGEFWVALGGILSVAFGVLLLVFPGDGLLFLVWLVGVWAIVFGFTSLGVANRLHGVDQGISRIAAAR